MTGLTATGGRLNLARAVGVAPPPADFSLSASPDSVTVVHRAPAGYTVSIAPAGGFADPVTLTVDGLLLDATGDLVPNPATTTSDLTVTTAATTPAGTYLLTITGTSGPSTRTTSVTLVVTDCTPPI